MLRWIRDRFSRRRWPTPVMFMPADQVPFAQRLSETQRWCTRPGRLDPRTSLRSHEIMPWILEPDPFRIVRYLAEQRRHKLEERSGDGPYRDPAPASGGRLLVHYPGLNLTDGAAELASDGFFDLWNLPPWDTWIAFGEQPTTARELSWATFLISWVPPQLVDHANLGVEINPEQCIAWLDDRQLARLLSAAKMP
jgi:hypothetical protein